MSWLERVALTCSQYCTVSLQFFAEKRLHILRNCSRLCGNPFRNKQYERVGLVSVFCYELESGTKLFW